MALIRNTITIAVVIIIYYLALLVIQYIFTVFDSITIFATWRTDWDPVTQTAWMFIIYFLIPVIIIATYIVNTKPDEEQAILGRFR